MRNYRCYPEYKDSGIEWLEEIPAHWEVVSVKHFAEIVNGATPRSSEPEYWNGDIAWATPDDLGQLRSRVLEDTSRHITQKGYASCGRTLVPPGSLVLSTRAPIGHLAIAGCELCINQGCRGLVLSEHDSAIYRYYSILAAKPILQSLGEGSTFRELPRDTLANVILPNPTQEEKNGIADFLDRETAKIDALIEKKERLIELLKEKRTALITHAVTKGLDPNVPMKDSGIEWLGQIPAHWEIRPLKRVTECLDGQRVPVNAEERALMQGEYPYWGANGILDYVDSWLFDEPLVLLGEDGAPFFEQDKPVAFYVCGKIWVNNHAHVLRPRPGTEPRFLSHVLNIVDYRAFIGGTTRDKLTQDDMRGIPIQLPNEKEQRAIADFLDRETAKIDALIGKIEEAINLLKEYRTALISAAVTGKIDVREEVGQKIEITRLIDRTTPS